MSELVKHLNEFDFESTISTTTKPVLVDFWAKWCFPCKMQAPILDELAKEVGNNAIIAKVDVDECESLAYKYGVASIPTLILFKNGEIVEKVIGLTEKSKLLEIINKNI